MARPVHAPKGSRFVILASVCVVVAALYFAQAVLIPLALAVLFCFLLAPLVTRLERWRVPRAPAVLLVVVAASSLVVALGGVVVAQLYNLAKNLPNYQGNIVHKVERLRGDGGPGVTAGVTKVIQAVQEATTQPAGGDAPAGGAGGGGGGNVVSGAIDTIAESPLRAAASESMGTPAPPAPSSPEEASGPPGTKEANALFVRLVDQSSPLATLGGYVGIVLAPLGTLGLVIVFVIFMLLSREDMRDRMLRLMGSGRINVTTTALDDAATRISRYLTAQAIVNGTYGVAIAIGLWLIGRFVGDKPFPSFVLWGLLCAVLRFIPYIGPWVAAAFPIALSLAVYDPITPFLVTVGMFVFIELLSNNLMEPWLYGTSTGMSTVAILVSAVFWTWLWGPVGLLLATPLTVILVVVGKYVPQLRFLDILLGDEPVLDPHVRVYQRLLAGDQEEATELTAEFLKDQSLEQVYDGVLIPALALAEQDRHHGRLDEGRQTFIRQAMRELVDELGDQYRAHVSREELDEIRRAAADTEAAARQDLNAPAASGDGGGNGSTGGVSAGSAATAAGDVGTRGYVPIPRTVPKQCRVNVVCLPANDEADEVVGLMLSQLLDLRGYCAFPVSVTKLASEMVETVEAHGAHAVVVSALPPAAVTHSRYLCKRLHGRYPDIKMTIGLWTAKGDLTKARDRITCDGSVHLVTSLADAVTQVGQLAQPVILAAGQESTATS